MITPLVIGRGKLARHLIHAFQAHEFPYYQIADARNFENDPDLHAKLTGCTHIWILTKDEAISEIATRITRLDMRRPILHSSGALHLDGATTLHPLMTFSDQLYDPAAYWEIPWISFTNEPVVEIPFLKNRILLGGGDRVRYHAACVMISNFSNLLWSAGSSLVPGLSRQHFMPILEQTLRNFGIAGASALTGPLKRGDTATVGKHLTALEELPEQKIYETFTEYYGERKNDHRP